MSPAGRGARRGRGAGEALRMRLLLEVHRLRGAVRQRRTRRQELAAFAAFSEFQRRLEPREDQVYMFFTRGLLHWLVHSLRFVPDDVPVALVGARLDAEERAWIEGNLRRPFHHIDLAMDDNAVLEFLFRTRKESFGWLHIDCFVLDPALFSEMASMPRDVALSYVWSHPGLPGLDTLHSAFVFVNGRVVQELSRRGVQVSPATYHYRGWQRGRTVTERALFSRVPSRRLVRILNGLAPATDPVLPFAPGAGDYFQVLVMYQLVCAALGFESRRVRNLVRDGTDSSSQYSNDIVHVNGAATYRRFKDAPETVLGRYYPLLLQADYLMLENFGDQAPRRYREVCADRAKEIEALGLSPREVRGNLVRFLTTRGLRTDRARLALSPD